MKYALLLTALLSLTEAAPVKIVTRMHTANPVTVWQTHTTNTVTVTGANTVNGPPPDLTTSTPTTTAVQEQPTTEEPVPTTSTTSPVEKVPTTSTPVTTTQQPATTSAVAKPEETTPTTTSVPTTSTPTTSSTPTTTTPTTSSTPTTTSTPTTSSTSTSTSTSTSSTSTSTSSTPTTTSTPVTTTSSSTSTSATATATSSLDDFQQEILDEHNNKRDLHGVQHLKWNQKLADYAANYAKNSFSCNNVQLIHSGGSYGENLAAGYTGGKDPVDAWYDEIEYYNFDDPGFSEKTGHFTQLVWKDTSEVGCAYVTCDNSWRQYTICEYSDSRGNIVGTNPKTGNNFFTDNVLKPVS